MGPLMKDSSWVRQSFLVGSDKNGKANLDDDDIRNRVLSNARFKFTDTTPGGNMCINPPPQFCRAADPKVKGLFGGSSGMGRYYSEAIDDNNQIIHMRFGVPAFNSLTTFFTGFYNTGAGQLARTGRSSSAFYMLGRAAGFVVSIMSWKLLAVHLIGVGLKFLAGKPTSKFYYLKPTMPLYWHAVQTMVNHIAVSRGIVPRIGSTEDGNRNDKYEFDQDALKKLHNLIPEIFMESGSIDVFAMSTRGQRLAKKYRDRMIEASNGDTAGFNQRLRSAVSDQLGEDTKPTFLGYLENYLKSAFSQPKETSSGEGEASASTESFKPDELSNDTFLDYFLDAEMDDGGAFASFRVNSTGQVSESFSNTVQESELAGKINGMSSSSRSTNFSLANGNLDDGIIGKVVGGVMSAVKDVATGIMDSLSVSGLAALGGAALVDIPKHWQSSSANLPRANYTISLVSPYGNPISQLLNIHVPLAMLLAGALPLSTGKQSYTSPFLLELYDQGRCQTRLGMIDSLTVTRGTANLGFDRDGHAMAIDVTFSVVDMSSIMHMPISEGFSVTRALVGGAAGAVAGGAVGAAAGAAVANGIFDEDTVFSDYMNILAGMGLADQIYQIRKLKLNMTRQMTDFKNWTSPARLASFAGDLLPARLIAGIFYKGTDRAN